MAMQRTLCSPRCCATSTTRLPGLSLIDGFEIRSAVLISGRSPPANSTSTTGPMTWTTLPWLVDCTLLMTLCVLSTDFWATLSTKLAFEGLGPAHDLHQLLGDGGLAGAVVLKREVGDHLFGVVGRAVHGGHARAQLGGDRLKETAVDLRLQ